MTLREELTEQLHRTILLMEDVCTLEELHGDGLSSVIYRRYQNAFSTLRDPNSGFSARRRDIQFLLSVNRAYIDRSNRWGDDLRDALMETDRLIDHFLNQK
ncbi:MAG: hypothetical protein PHD67_04650 [Oscillospiraceae bacterium]|nr:hypothetical protein [Oscillospiraceae bacterium]